MDELVKESDEVKTVAEKIATDLLNKCDTLTCYNVVLKLRQIMSVEFAAMSRNVESEARSRDEWAKKLAELATSV